MNSIWWMRIKAIFNAHPNDIIWYIHFNSICLCHINSALSISTHSTAQYPIWIRCMRPWQPFFCLMAPKSASPSEHMSILFVVHTLRMCERGVHICFCWKTRLSNKRASSAKLRFFFIGIWMTRNDWLVLLIRLTSCFRLSKIQVSSIYWRRHCLMSKALKLRAIS